MSWLSRTLHRCPHCGSYFDGHWWERGNRLVVTRVCDTCRVDGHNAYDEVMRRLALLELTCGVHDAKLASLDTRVSVLAAHRAIDDLTQETGRALQ